MGELARQPGCPGLATTPLELLSPDYNKAVVWGEISKWAWPVLGVTSGLMVAIGRNLLLYRPSWAGIHTHFFLAGGAALIMTYIRDFNYASRAETDEIYRHYVTLHPEDFPPFERKRYRDVYKPFEPMR